MEKNQLAVFNHTIKSEEEYIFVKPLCDFFKIDYQNQVEKIGNDPILSLCYGKKPNKKVFGDSYLRICLPKKGFVRWIQLINPNTLPENLREKFIQYQADIFDFFYGTAEEENDIRRLMEEQQRIDDQLKELSARKRNVHRSLNAALYGRYQYQLEFNA